MSDLIAPPPGAHSGIKRELYVEAKDFEILDFVQEGSFGKVYRGRRVSTGERVALKFFDYTHNQSDGNWVDVEIDRMAESNEITGIARLLGVFYDSDEGLLMALGERKKGGSVRRQKVIVMELLEGGEVYERVATLGPSFSERDASAILESVVKVFDQLHAKRRINPDFKLENCVFVSKEPKNLEIKVIDLGLVRPIPDEQLVVRIPKPRNSPGIGTPNFLAPESLSPTCEYSYKSDVFQIGCFLFMMLCADQPFLPDHDSECMKDPRAWPKLESRSEQAKDLISRMLDYNPKTRISAHDVLEHPFIKHRQALSDKDLGAEYIGAIRGLNLRKRFRGLLQTSATRGHEQRVSITSLVQDSEALSVLADGSYFLILKKSFLESSGGSVSNKIPRDAFKAVASGCGLGVLARDDVCAVFDPENEGIGYCDFIVALASFRYPEFAKMDPRGLFDILDLNADGMVTKDEILTVLRVMLHTNAKEEKDLVELFEAIDVVKEGPDGIDIYELEAFLDRNTTTRRRPAEYYANGAAFAGGHGSKGLRGVIKSLLSVFGFDGKK